MNTISNTRHIKTVCDVYKQLHNLISNASTRLEHFMGLADFKLKTALFISQSFWQLYISPTDTVYSTKTMYIETI